MTRVRKTFLLNEMATQGPMFQPVFVTGNRHKSAGTKAAADYTYSCQAGGEFWCNVTIQNVILQVEKVFTAAGLPFLNLRFLSLTFQLVAGFCELGADREESAEGVES